MCAVRTLTLLSALAVRLHVGPEKGVDPGLVAFALGFEPVQYGGQCPPYTSRLSSFMANLQPTASA
jgi:hypothetical protein